MSKSFETAGRVLIVIQIASGILQNPQPFFETVEIGVD
jgi:hypothetical protein